MMLVKHMNLVKQMMLIKTDDPGQINDPCQPHNYHTCR